MGPKPRKSVATAPVRAARGAENDVAESFRRARGAVSQVARDIKDLRGRAGALVKKPRPPG
jgi:hypothetical protein